MTARDARSVGPSDGLHALFLRRLRAAAWFLAFGCGFLFCGAILAGGIVGGSSSLMAMVAFGEAAMLAFLPAWFLLGRAVRFTPWILEDSPLRPFRFAFLASAFGYAGGFAVAAGSIFASWGTVMMGVWTVPVVALLSYVPATYVAVVGAHAALFALAARGLPTRFFRFFLLGASALGLGAAAGLASQLLVPREVSRTIPWIGLVGVGYVILAVACGAAVRRLSGVPSRDPAGPSRDPSP